MYSCTADSRADRCGGPLAITSFTSTGTASVVAGSDPFKGSPTHQDGNDCDANPACNSDDAVAVTSVQLADFGGATATLLNVCSYPSQEPNSDPSDCVFVPDSGFIRIVKDATPNTTATFSFTLDGVSAFSTNGDGTSALLPVSSSTNHSVAETAATGWELSTASCLKADGTTTTGTLSGTTISGIDPNPGEVVTCTFNNIQSTGTLTLVKTVDNLGETGAQGRQRFPAHDRRELDDLRYRRDRHGRESHDRRDRAGRLHRRHVVVHGRHDRHGGLGVGDGRRQRRRERHLHDHEHADRRPGVVVGEVGVAEFV